MLFAGAGFEVCLYDVESQQVSSALEDISKQLHHLESIGMLRGKLSADQQFNLVKGSQDFSLCVADAVFIQVMTKNLTVTFRTCRALMHGLLPVMNDVLLRRQFYACYFPLTGF